MLSICTDVTRSIKYLFAFLLSFFFICLLRSLGNQWQILCDAVHNFVERKKRNWTEKKNFVITKPINGARFRGFFLDFVYRIERDFHIWFVKFSRCVCAKTDVDNNFASSLLLSQIHIAELIYILQDHRTPIPITPIIRTHVFSFSL